jgi:hypothetical protein
VWVERRSATLQYRSQRAEIEPAFAGAARVVEAEYEWPFQSHASMGPACAVVDARPDSATLWTGSQKPHFARDGVARILGLPPDKVHGIWVPGPGSYGRNDAGDAGIDAALLSKAVARPVRVQGMRWEGHGWDAKGPASIHRARAALDKDGGVIGYVFESKGFSRVDIDTNESDPAYSLAGQLTGLACDDTSRRLPHGYRAILDVRKLADYCLSSPHPRGRHKARVFREALGLERTEARWLRASARSSTL